MKHNVGDLLLNFVILLMVSCVVFFVAAGAHALSLKPAHASPEPRWEYMIVVPAKADTPYKLPGGWEPVALNQNGWYGQVLVKRRVP